jgi:tRNA threonylcarbamoyladenosine biosynthesis protein TsaE
MTEPVSTGVATIVDEAGLEAWGRDVGAAAATGRLSLPLVMALRGELGAGKSTLARAVARGAGVQGPIPSPTYNLRFAYEGDGVHVHHLDLYRLEDPADVWELGWEELGEGRQVVLIEWPERVEALLPADRWEIRLGFVPAEGGLDPGRRSMTVEAQGGAARPLPAEGRSS